jgi:hypothetical protein
MRNFYSIKNGGVLTVLFVTALLTLSGCKDGSGKLGVEIPADVQPVKLAAVLEAPAEYNGKQVVMKGIIAGQCPSYCEFTFRDGVHKATIFPEGFKFPKLETGKPVSVLAKVTAGPDNVVFSALGVRIEKGDKT